MPGLWQPGAVNALRLRPSTDDDVDAMLDVVQRAHLALTGRAHDMTRERVIGLRSAPGRDSGAEFPVVERAGRVVAWAGLFAFAPYSEVVVMQHLDPDLDDQGYRAAAGLLVDAGQREGLLRIAGLPADPSRVLASESLREDSRLATVLVDLGLALDRNSYEMEIDLVGRDLTPAPWPPGLDVRRMHGTEDAEAVSAVFLEAFRDHQGDLPFTPDLVRHVLAADDARSDLSYLAYDAEGPVGAILCRDRPSHGYVWVLGVLRRGRRRGLAQALLTHAFAEFAADGRTRVALEVEAQSLTGATRVYERAGMTVRAVHDTWTRPLERGR